MKLKTFKCTFLCKFSSIKSIKWYKERKILKQYQLKNKHTILAIYQNTDIFNFLDKGLLLSANQRDYKENYKKSEINQTLQITSVEISTWNILLNSNSSRAFAYFQPVNFNSISLQVTPVCFSILKIIFFFWKIQCISCWLKQ